MPWYHFEFSDEAGELKTGLINAKSEAAAIRRVKLLLDGASFQLQFHHLGDSDLYESKED